VISALHGLTMNVALQAGWRRRFEQASAILRLSTFMSRDTLLIVLTATGSALCWWPGIMHPNLHLSTWSLPLACVSLGTVLSTTLSDDGWLEFLLASFVGSVAGICSGFWIWWPTDGIDASFVPWVIASAILRIAPVVVVSLIAGLALRCAPVWIEKYRRALWLAFIGWVAFGPIMVALTPLLIAYR